MLRFLRAGAALALATAVAAQPAAAIPFPPVTQGPAPLKLSPGQWPQARSDVAADPDTRFGALPNGMRYAIRRQTVPPHQAAIRFWFDAGSLMETDDQQGLAHFLEHMAFNGSKGVKENEMVKMLERLGLSFGGDTNASTQFAQTIYTLDLPQTDDATVDTSLMLMREAAGRLTLTKAAVDRERGVVLSEERARDTPDYRVFIGRLNFLFEGQRLPKRLPIGKVEVLQNAPPARIADFYRRYYRPERAVLVVVGDFDPDKMEAKVRKLFGDWRGVGPAGADPDLGPVKPRGAAARLMVEPGAQPYLSINWVSAPDLRPDTLAARRHDLVEQLGLAVLNRRLQAIGRSANPPFIAAGASKGEEEHSAEVATIAVRSEPARWREGLQAIEKEQRRLTLYGVRQDELDREIEEVRAGLKAAVAGAATRRPAELAGQIVGSLSDQEVVTNPAQSQAFFEAAVKDLKAEEVSAAMKSVFVGSGPLIFMASPTPVEGGEKALLEALAESEKAPVTPPAALAQLTWPYESFGPPGQVTETRKVEDLGVTFVRFANGVRLTVKPTKFRDDQVLVNVAIGDGMLGLPKDRQPSSWASSIFTEGGLKKISKDDMDRVLAAKVFSVGFGIGDDALTLTGSTRTSDLATELQVLAAYVAEPGWRPEPFVRLKASAATIHDQLESTDSGVLQRDLGGLLHSGDRRWTFPSREEIAALTLGDVQRDVTPGLSTGAIEITVVGDVTVDQASDLVARTFGALPPRPEAAPAPAAQRQVTFPAGGKPPVVLTHKGRADQAIGYVAWPTADFWSDPQRARTVAVLGEVLRNRLVETLREKEGATYSPGVSYQYSTVWTGYGYIAASVEVPPAKVQPFFDEVARIAADLRTREVSPDELARAKKPRIEAIQRAKVTNGYWLTELSRAQSDPRRLDNIRQIVPGTEQVTAADVRRVAAEFLKDQAAFRLIIRPQAAPPPTTTFAPAAAK